MVRAAVLGVLLLCGGWSWSAAAAPKKLKVLTSFMPVYCFTVNVAGDLADVENLLPGNVGPHDYQFSRRDVQKVNAADVIVVNGLGLESWLDKLLQNAGRPKVVVEAAAGLRGELITRMPQLETEGKPAAASPPQAAEGRPNPHIWLDPHLAAHAVTNILATLQKADPAHAAGYAANAAGYVDRLGKLDADIRQGLAPAKNSPVVTYHDAFPYFARRYDLWIVGVIEVVPDVEPSPRYLAELGQAVRRQGVKVIFTEPQYSGKLARQFGQDLNVPVAPLDTLETGPLTPTAYADAMRGNLRVLQKYLLPHAPAPGT